MNDESELYATNDNSESDVNKSVAGAPYSIKGYGYNLQSVTQPNTMVKSTMTETVPS